MAAKGDEEHANKAQCGMERKNSSLTSHDDESSLGKFCAPPPT